MPRVPGSVKVNTINNNGNAVRLGQDAVFSVFMPTPFSMGGGGGGGHIVSLLSVRISVRPVRNTFGFRAISFERIGILDLKFYTQVYNQKM